MIKEIVLHNFKSYAGEQRVGPFHKVAAHTRACLPLTVPVQCFSAVVGPNGSGKSNVIDAMLFVFGKKAKQVRGPDVVPHTTLLHTHSSGSTKSANSSTTLPAIPTWTKHACRCTFRRSSTLYVPPLMGFHSSMC